MRVGASIASLYLDFAFSKRHSMNPILFGFLSVLTVVIIASGTIARVYLFAHTINQILFGGSLGIAIAFFMHFCVKKQVYKHLT